MKTLAGFVFALVVGVANAAPDALDRYEEWYALAVESNVLRDLACESHNHKTGNSHLSCGSYGSNLIGGLALARTPTSDKTLAQTLAFGLDAGPSESRRCMALIRGKPLLPALRALDPKQVRQKCMTLFSDPEQNIANDYPKADPERVCNSVSRIQSLRVSLVGEIELGTTCEPWNID